MATSFSQPLGIMNFLASSPDYGKMMSEGVKQNLMRTAGELASNSRIAGSGITGHFNKEGAKAKAKGVRAMGAAEGNAAMYGGIAQGVQGIAGGFMDRPSGGNSTSGFNINSFGNYTDEFTKPADMTGFGFNTGGTMYSGFVNQDLA